MVGNYLDFKFANYEPDVVSLLDGLKAQIRKHKLAEFRLYRSISEIYVGGGGCECVLYFQKSSNKLLGGGVTVVKMSSLLMILPCWIRYFDVSFFT